MGSNGRLTAICALLLTAVCAGQTRAQTSSRNDRETAAVIRTALDSIFRTGGESPKTVLLFDSLLRPATLTDGNATSVLANKLDLDPTTLADFLARALPFIPYGQRSWPATPYPQGFKYPRAVFKSISWMDSVVRAAPVSKTIDQTDSSWMSMARQYPGAWGITALSVPGFNRDTTEALISVRHSCGFACHSDEVMLLRKTLKKWRVVDRIRNYGSEKFAIGSLRYVGSDAHLLVQARREADSTRRAIADSVRQSKRAGLITGVVRNGATGGVIAGAKVVYLRFSPEPVDSSVTTVADKNGRFEFRNPKPGNVALIAECGTNPTNQIAAASVQVLPGTRADLELTASNLTQCWNRTVPALSSGELASPFYTGSRYPTNPEAGVYRAVINEFAEKSNAASVIVEGITRRRCGRTHHCAPLNATNLARDGVIDSVALADFKQRSSHTDPLNPSAMSRLGLTILPEGERTYLTQQGGGRTGSYVDYPESGLWKSLQQVRPAVKAILALSHVGFSADGNQAIVEVLPQNESDYPEDDVLLLERRENEWRIARHHLEETPVSGAIVNGACVAVTPGAPVSDSDVASLHGEYDFQLVASATDGGVTHWSKNFDPDNSRMVQLDGFSYDITIHRIQGDMIFGQWTYGGGGYLLWVENGFVVPEQAGHFCAVKRKR